MTDQAVPTYKNRRQVFLYLKKCGYRISEAQFYRHVDAGKLRVEPDGSVLEVQVANYVENHLAVSLESLQDIKAKKEIEKLDEQIAKLRFEREKDMGKYIPRKDFELELASRALVFENGFRHLFATQAQEWISFLGGKPDRLAEFLRMLNQALDEQLSSYATTKIFQVLIIDEEDNHADNNE